MQMLGVKTPNKVDGYLLIFQRLEPALKSIVDRNDFMHEETFAWAG